MTFLAKFDENGYSIAFIPNDNDITEEKHQTLTDEGYIEITEEDWHYYIGNMGDGDHGTGYIRDTITGKPISAPPKPVDLDFIKTNVIVQLKSIRDTKEIELIAYKNTLLDFDKTSIMRMDIAQKFLINNPNIEYIEWTTAENTRINMTKEDFDNINNLAAIRSDALHKTYNQLKHQVLEAETEEEINLILQSAFTNVE